MGTGECPSECCDSDFCNGGEKGGNGSGSAVPMVSTFLMLACVLATFFR